MVKRRWIALLTAFLLAVGLFSGCGQTRSETVKWICAACALPTAANGGDVDQIGGYVKSEANTAVIQDVLKDSWDVEDRSSADALLDWLLTEGHRADYTSEMKVLDDSGVLTLSVEDAEAALQDLGLSQELTACYLAMAEAYRSHGAEAIDAWDYCRALQLLGWYYLAGYYTQEETLDCSLEVAQKLQQRYSSWDEMAESYLWGYNYWAEDDPNDPGSNTAACKKIYEQLKADQDGPYTLAWDTVLQKDW